MDNMNERIFLAIASGSRHEIAVTSEDVAKKVGILFNPGDYNEYQMIELLRGVEAGLERQDIERYFRPDYSDLQMVQIRRAIQDGLTEEQIKSITESHDSWLKMAYLRHVYLAEKLEKEERESNLTKKQESFKNYTEYRTTYSDITEREDIDGTPVKVQVTGHSLDKVQDGHMSQRTKYEGTYITPKDEINSLAKKLLAGKDKEERERQYSENERKEVVRNGL